MVAHEAALGASRRPGRGSSRRSPAGDRHVTADGHAALPPFGRRSQGVNRSDDPSRRTSQPRAAPFRFCNRRRYRLCRSRRRVTAHTGDRPGPAPARAPGDRAARCPPSRARAVATCERSSWVVARSCSSPHSSWPRWAPSWCSCTPTTPATRGSREPGARAGPGGQVQDRGRHDRCRSLDRRRLRAAGDPAAVDVVPGALSDATPLADLVAIAPIFAGQQIIAAQWGTTGQTTGLSIPDGKIALSVQLGDPERVAGFIAPGSTVAIFATGGPKVQALLSNIPVIGVGPSGSVPAAAPTARPTATSSRSPRRSSRSRSPRQEAREDHLRAGQGRPGHLHGPLPRPHERQLQGRRGRSRRRRRQPVPLILRRTHRAHPHRGRGHCTHDCDRRVRPAGRRGHQGRPRP